MNQSVETMYVDRDIELACLPPVVFPDGIAAAFSVLEQRFPETGYRNRYGLSRPEAGGNILYRAAVELLPDDDFPEGMQRMILPKGNYAYFNIPDFMNNISLIGASFERLTALSDIDPEGYCIEWYTGTRDLRCKILLK